MVTNESSESNHVVAYTALAEEETASATSNLNDWPPGVYSLSHVALPFAPTDPLYGGPEAGHSPGIALGNLAPRGERGILRVSGTDLLRLRWNPFYDYVEDRVLQFTGLVQQ